jgi:uroporphyrin-3 C-methyltransferase
MSAANHQSPPAARASATYWLALWALLASAALVLAGWQWFETRNRLGEVQEEVSRRLSAADNAGKEDRGALKQMREQIDALQAKLGANESRLAEFQGQTESLKTLYQEMARGREETTLLEVEQAITLAGQQLQLAGNVQAAIFALRAADARLARLDRPQFMALRKAVGRDLERLQALPVVDLAGMSLHIEQALLGIDKLPLSSYGRPAIVAEKLLDAPIQPWWQQAGSDLWAEIKGLIRIQRFDRDEAVLLAPGQEFFLRENLKLRLLNARLAMLSHDQATFRSELKAAQAILTRHFVAEDRSVETLKVSLRQLLSSELNVELPRLDESLAALRSLRGASKGKP